MRKKIAEGVYRTDEPITLKMSENLSVGLVIEQLKQSLIHLNIIKENHQEIGSKKVNEMILETKEHIKDLEKHLYDQF